MSLTMHAPTERDESVRTFADQIADLTKGEVDGVSSETIELIVSVARSRQPVRAQARTGSRLTDAESQQVVEQAVDVLEEAYISSGRDKEVGLELITFAVARLGCRFKPLARFANELDGDHPGMKDKVVQRVKHKIAAEQWRGKKVSW